MAEKVLLNVLVPLYEDIELARGCLDSIVDFAIVNPHLQLKIKLSDDSRPLIVHEVLDGLVFNDNVEVSVCPARSRATKNHAVENWNYLLAQIEENSYYILLHHDERLPKGQLLLNGGDTYILGLGGVANRRKYQLSRNFVAFILSYYPHLFYFFNLIGPTACVITKHREYFNTNLRWLVDVDFYVRLCKITRNFSMSELLVESVKNSQSITNSLDHYRMTLQEAKIIGISPLGILVLKFKFFLKNLLQKKSSS